MIPELGIMVALGSATKKNAAVSQLLTRNVLRLITDLFIHE